MFAFQGPTVGPASKKRKIVQSSEAESSSSAGVDKKDQSDQKDMSSNEGSKTGTVFYYGAILPEEFGRYPNEPNCLWVKGHKELSVVGMSFEPKHDHCKLAFTELFLTTLFAYFRAALSRQSGKRKFAEGETKLFHFDNITSQAFARIFTYIERKYRRGDIYGEDFQYRPETVHDLLQAVIAADYLGLVDFDKFEAYIAERLAFTLVMNRLRLNPAVLLLVTQHHAFRSGVLWDVCVKAGVRVQLQVRKEERPKYCRWKHADAFTADEYMGKCTWEDIRNHYAKMEKELPWYADGVQQAVRQTLRLRERRVEKDGKMMRAYRDPCEDPMFEYTRHLWTVWPLRSFIRNA